LAANRFIYRRTGPRLQGCCWLLCVVVLRAADACPKPCPRPCPGPCPRPCPCPCPPQSQSQSRLLPPRPPSRVEYSVLSPLSPWPLPLLPRRSSSSARDPPPRTPSAPRPPPCPASCRVVAAPDTDPLPDPDASASEQAAYDCAETRTVPPRRCRRSAAPSRRGAASRRQASGKPSWVPRQASRRAASSRSRELELELLLFKPCSTRATP
jgi:hypothetical protein